MAHLNTQKMPGEIDDPMSPATFELVGIRSVLFLPFRKDGILLGRISPSRPEVKPLTEKEIALLESFAPQVVIEIENARLPAGEKLGSGSGYSRPLSAYSVRQSARLLWGLPWRNGSRYDALFWMKECAKSWSPFAETLSKKEIQRPIQRPLGAV